MNILIPGVVTIAGAVLFCRHIRGLMLEMRDTINRMEAGIASHSIAMKMLREAIDGIRIDEAMIDLKKTIEEIRTEIDTEKLRESIDGDVARRMEEIFDKRDASLSNNMMMAKRCVEDSIRDVCDVYDDAQVAHDTFHRWNGLFPQYAIQ